MIQQSKLSEKQKSLDILNSKIMACEKCTLSLTRQHALLTHPSALLYKPSLEPETIEKYKKLLTYL